MVHALPVELSKGAPTKMCYAGRASKIEVGDICVEKKKLPCERVWGGTRKKTIIF